MQRVHHGVVVRAQRRDDLSSTRDLGAVTLAGSALVLVATVGCGRIGFDTADDPSDAVVDSTTDATVDSMPATSCASLAPTCGPVASTSCCESSTLPAGTFFRGHDVGTDAMYTNMTAPATIGDVRLDLYEVTVGRFREFVEAGMGTQANPPTTGAGARTLNGMPDQAGWDPSWNVALPANRSELESRLACGSTPTWTATPGGNEQRAITCIDWYTAHAFCAWDGGFLPTDAEWSYAGAGGDEQRAFPWSNPPSSLVTGPTYASYYNGSTCIADGTSGCTLSDLFPVGTLPMGDGRWGHADLGGNACEWVLDWWEIPYTVPCDNCALLVPTAGRGVRGACIGGGTPRAAFRSSGYPPGNRDSNFTVRCARAP